MTKGRVAVAPDSFDWLNKSQLQVITKMSAAVIKRVIDANIADIPTKESNAKIGLYHAHKALQFLYIDKFGISEEDVLDERQTRARLNIEQTKTAEIRNQILLKKLIKAEDLEPHWADIIAKVKAKLLTLPVIVATECVGIDEIKVIQGTAKKIVYQALEELAVEMMPEIDYDTVDESSIEGG